jgi:predicted nucleic-acid-binding Zn-ribbon protein
MYPSWTTTLHSTIFSNGIDGYLSSHYSGSCIKCHTTGYDTNAAALADDGFYSTALKDNWTFPSMLSPTNYSSMPYNLRSLANVTCENCHGPGYDHAQSYGDTNLPGWPLLDVPYTVGTCEQCHDSPPTEAYGAQWYASSHAVTTTIPTGSGRDQCVKCHTALGFITSVSNTLSTNTMFAPTNTTYYAIGCQTCHEPHGLTTPANDSHLLRIMASATFGDGTVITNGGEGNLCMNCHHSRDGDAVTNVINYKLGLATWAGGSSFGPHDGVQGDMIEGINAITYGQTIPSSAHRESVTNSCVGCHMQTLASSNPGFLLSGGHTFEMSYNVITNGVTNKIDQVAVCNQCHGGITTFNFPVEDYANTGAIQGVQTEVQILLNQLSAMLPNKNGVIAGVAQTSLTTTTNWTTNQLNAAYNWQFVNNDGSLGVHNAPFATGLLKASIANLTGVSVPGGLPDAWEIANFGSLTNALGAPNADPAGDGIPNWLKYSLGLNPLAPGLSVPNGVVYVNGSTTGGSTNTIQIYTAADVTFDTVAGTTYQIQEVSSLSQGWQNVGNPIVATKTASMSYLTPTVGNTQQFFRVVSY